MKKRKHQLSASMTVEASYVMAVVIMSMAFMIRTASNECFRSVQVMRLHHITEQLRYRERGEERIWSWGQAAKRHSMVEGYVEIDSWKKEITAKVHEPEEILRMLTIFEGEEAEQK